MFSEATFLSLFQVPGTKPCPPPFLGVNLRLAVLGAAPGRHGRLSRPPRRGCALICKNSY